MMTQGTAEASSLKVSGCREFIFNDLNSFCGGMLCMHLHDAVKRLKNVRGINYKPNQNRPLTALPVLDANTGALQVWAAKRMAEEMLTTLRERKKFPECADLSERKISAAHVYAALVEYTDTNFKALQEFDDMLERISGGSLDRECVSLVSSAVQKANRTSATRSPSSFSKLVYNEIEKGKAGTGVGDAMNQMREIQQEAEMQARAEKAAKMQQVLEGLSEEEGDLQQQLRDLQTRKEAAEAAVKEDAEEEGGGGGMSDDIEMGGTIE
uniref:Uncharacterized protein n=1 Tax=Chromera velia CCMP2878 TaxID=1169474 RepID=A0A0G4HHJ4_9ALVE|eukprot:Cvel_27686.t1-p1 / transcript=Cvel_27686.t1 / gene=Cvel_27686 / organism=Chromera_velia_CCMP2878 / gene_product=hypothetical protein / transcript_product=hypothetical protein / location=Cvel_scaffold3494:6005-8389(-) / protein_length=267 / sequence_SO=supercontig / SO=protein_coding / is_pseudo=false